MSLSVSPSESGFPYSIPTIILPDGKYLMDSRKIVNFIEEKYPEPTVHLDSPYLAKIEAIMTRVTPPLRPVYLFAVSDRLLNERSRVYYRQNRAHWAGMPLEQFEKEQGGEAAWERTAPILQEVVELLRENPEGPFFMGTTVSYADFIWGAFLIFLQRIGQELYDEALNKSGDAKAFADLMEGLSPWTKRDGY
jgi:glutathione S-transferase